MPSILSANTLSSGYDVANSVRFNVADNAKLSRSISGSPTDPDKFTISFWMKKCALSNQVVFGNYANGNFRSELSFSSDDRLQYFQVNDGSASFDVVLSRQFRDPNAWFHIVFVYDTGQGTDTNRFKFFVNGVHDTNYSHNSPFPAQDLDGRLNQASQTLVIGQDGNDAKDFNGYLAEVVLIDGQALDADQFGEFDSDSGIWKPIDVSELTFGDDGFYLDFETDGTNAGFVDFSSNNYAITRVGSTIHSFAQAKFDSSSIYFDGSGDALTLADGNQWDFGTGDYTLEFWVNKAHTGKESVFETRGGGGNGFNIEFNSSNVLEWYDGSITGTLPVDGSAVTANTWVHFAFVRASNVHKMYRNGTEVGTALTSSSSQQSTGGPNIGRRLESSSANDYTGYLDEIRLSTVARYTSNFTAPSAAFTDPATANHFSKTGTIIATNDSPTNGDA